MPAPSAPPPGAARPGRVEVSSSAPAEDLRTLPVAYDAGGFRFRDYRDCVEKLTTSEFPDWKVQGPRTTAWLLREINRQGLTPLRRHDWWRSTLRLGPADWGVGEHESLSRILEVAVVYDQLNAGGVCALELASRRFQ